MMQKTNSSRGDKSPSLCFKKRCHPFGQTANKCLCRQNYKNYSKKKGKYAKKVSLCHKNNLIGVIFPLFIVSFRVASRFFLSQKAIKTTFLLIK